MLKKVVKFENLYTILIGEVEGRYRPLRGEEMISRKEQWPFSRMDGAYDSL